MIRSDRELARQLASALSSSNDVLVSQGAGKVEETLAKTSRAPAHFLDPVTAMAIASLIVKVAELSFKIWKELKDSKEAPEKEQLKKRIVDSLPAKDTAVAGLTEIVSEAVEAIIRGLSE